MDDNKTISDELTEVHRKIKFLGVAVILHAGCTALLTILVLVHALAASR